MQIHIVKHIQISLIGKADVVHIHLSLYVGQLHGVRRVLHGRLRPHQLQKAGKTGSAVGQQLGKVGQLPHGIHKGCDIQTEGDQVHGIQLAPHNEDAAGGDHRHGENGQEEFHHAVESAHRLMKFLLGGFINVIGDIELLQFLRLVGEGLCRADAGDTGLDPRVNGGGFLLHMAGRLTHRPAAGPHHDQKHRQNGGDHQRQPPLDRKHDDKRADDGHAGDENILRAVMGQLRDLKQLAGQAAHQSAGPIAVIVAEIQFLHVAEQIPADVRLYQNTKSVPVVADDIGQHPPHRKSRCGHCHHREKGAVCVLRKQLVHAPAGQVRKGQIDQRNGKGADHIQHKQLLMGFEIRQKDPQIGPLLKFLGGHEKFKAPLTEYNRFFRLLSASGGPIAASYHDFPTLAMGKQPPERAASGELSEKRMLSCWPNSLPSCSRWWFFRRCRRR